MKIKSFLFSVVVGAIMLASCSDDDDSKAKINVEFDTLNVTSTSVEFTWKTVETAIGYEIIIYQDDAVLYTEDAFLPPHTVKDLEPATDYKAKIFLKYLVNDNEEAGEFSFTTKEKVDDTPENLVLGALSVGDGETLKTDMMGDYSISFAVPRPKGWSYDSEAELTLYLGDSEEALEAIDDPIDWSMQVGSSNKVTFPDDMAAGTHYWKVSLDFTIDGETTTQESAVHNFIIE